MKKLLLFLIILILVLFGGGYFLINTGPSVNVTYTYTDYENLIKKTNIEINAIEEVNLFAIGKNQYETLGVQPAEITISNAEMSAFIEEANKDQGPIKDFAVAFHENNTGELSFKLTESFADFLVEENLVFNIKKRKLALSPLIAFTSASNDLTDFVTNYITTVAANKPVYAKGQLLKTSSNTISVKIESLKVGQISMNAQVISRVEREVVAFVNGFITSDNGFHIETLRVEDGKLYYKGTLPESINGTQIK